MDEETQRLMAMMALRARARPEFIGYYLTDDLQGQLACSDQFLWRLAITPVPVGRARIRQVAEYFGISPVLLLEILGR